MNIRERFDWLWMPEPNSGCCMWIGAQRSTGYGSFQMGSRATKNRRIESAHRVSWEIYKGPIPKGICVLHRCDTPLCVNPAHLFLGTLTDNNRDMCRKGRQRGRRSSPALPLSESEVMSIRRDLRSQRKIAASYGMSQSNVSLIKREVTWKGLS